MSRQLITRRKASIAGGTIAILAVVVMGPAWALADDVQLIPGTTFKQAIGGRVRGQVQTETPGEVVVTLGANTATVPTDQIASIRYDGQPASFQLGETREAAGQLVEAAEQFRKAAAESGDRPFVVQSALFREASALADLALLEPDRVKEAKDKLTRFAKTYPGGRHIAAVRESLARLQVHTGDYAAAETTISELARLPRAAERAAMLKARVLARQGQHAEAVSELDRLIATLPEKSAQQREARLVKAESLVGLKKFKEAEVLVRLVIQAAPPEDVAAQSAAYNTLGDCLRAANRPKEALLAYLHTDLLYSKDKEEHPRALFRLQELFRKTGQATRADEFAQRLKQEYPRSSWLNARSPES